jgi:isopentenyl diphosphate isomerase/L-lactate dehydrogenase-like FMN-dependent dehydrogenase
VTAVFDSRNARRIECVEDARLIARRRLPGFLYQRYEGGSGKGLTLRANEAAFEEVGFRPRAGFGAPPRDLRTSTLGMPLSMPVMLAPAGVLRLGHREGELAVARAASAADTAFVLSTSTGTPVEKVAAAATGPFLYQLHYIGGRQSAESMIERAKRSGARALVVTIDQGPGPRERARGERAYAPHSLAPASLMPAMPQFARRPLWTAEFIGHPRGLTLPMKEQADGRTTSIFDMPKLLFQQTPCWDDMAWIRELWGGPLVVKGVLSPEDAMRAVDAGAAAVVVSNHGGNCLDGRPATLRCLPEVVSAVGDQIEVWMDGGVRRGADVVKAVALGARVVLVGRAYVWALMAAGQPGIEKILEILRRGIDQTLTSLGQPSVSNLDRSLVELPGSWSRGDPAPSDPVAQLRTA